MDKQIIEWLNIFAKYKVDDDRISVCDDDILIYFTAFSDSDTKKLNDLWWSRYRDSINVYYYHIA